MSRRGPQHPAHAWLAAATLATMIGVATAAFRGDGSAINSYLFLDLGWSHVAAARFERSAIVLVLLSCLAGAWSWRWRLFLPAAAWLFTEALARLHVQGQAFSTWALLTHAPRYVVPLALTALLCGGRWSQPVVRAGLRAALATVFAAHGLEAFLGHPEFVDLVISSAAIVPGWRISETNARALLEMIGVMDFAIAGGLLLRPHPVVLAWAAAWGAISALARVTANGGGAYPEVLLRATHFLGPVALWALLAQRTTAGAPQSDTPAPAPAAKPVSSC